MFRSGCNRILHIMWKDMCSWVCWFTLGFFLNFRYIFNLWSISVSDGVNKVRQCAGSRSAGRGRSPRFTRPKGAKDQAYKMKEKFVLTWGFCVIIYWKYTNKEVAMSHADVLALKLCDRAQCKHGEPQWWWPAQEPRFEPETFWIWGSSRNIKLRIRSMFSLL
jgi:hypothetical protein